MSDNFFEDRLGLFDDRIESDVLAKYVEKQLRGSETEA